MNWIEASCDWKRVQLPEAVVQGANHEHPRVMYHGVSQRGWSWDDELYSLVTIAPHMYRVMGLRPHDVP